MVNTFRCSVCTKSFRQEKYLKIHIHMHNRKKSNSCSVCYKIYTCAEALKRHIETHRKQKSYTCLICNKSLSSASTLRNHTQGHTGNKPFSCSICLKTFSSTQTQRSIKEPTQERSQNIKEPHTGSHRKQAFQLLNLFKNHFPSPNTLRYT